MSQLIAALDQLASGSGGRTCASMLHRYVVGGNEKDLAKAKKLVTNYYELWSLRGCWEALPAPSAVVAADQRFLHAAIELKLTRDACDWWVDWTAKQPNQAEHFATLLQAFGEGTTARLGAAAAAMNHLHERLELADGKPSAVGSFLLSLTDQELAAAGEMAETLQQALAFLLRHVPERVRPIAKSFLHDGEFRCVSPECCGCLLASDTAYYEPVVAAMLTPDLPLGLEGNLTRLLAGYFPGKYLSPARAVNLRLVDPELGSNWSSTESCAWLLRQFGTAILPELRAHFERFDNSYQVLENFQNANAILGDASEIYRMACKHPAHEVRLAAVEKLIAAAHPEDDDLIRDTLLAGLTHADPKVVISFIATGYRWRPSALEDSLWKLLEHKSKPVRETAARALGKLGDSAIAPASGLLASKKAATRAAAVTLLSWVDSAPAAEVLRERLEYETDEDVRDQILVALEKQREAECTQISQAEIARRIARVAAKFEQPIAEWLETSKLPPLVFIEDGRQLSREEANYLLFRQSRAKNIAVDVELKPMLALIDRGSSGDFALAVLQQFLGSRMEAEDRWALALAALLGDDRLVSPLMQQIRVWIDKKRGKLAEYAAQALALLGTNSALCALDMLAVRYRSKQKNVGKAASEAFAEAAERLGVPVDELGDRVVPWLGFEPGRPRVIERDGKRVEVRIGSDFKLTFRDLVKDKPMTSLPAWAPAEVKTEFKDLGGLMREVVKGQFTRVENLMVRQYRWSAARWRELYLGHPLLFPFATRLIWGQYDARGQRVAIFRALEERSLTNELDEAVALSDEQDVGIVHPLELDAEQLGAWQRHLADYNVEPPFLQLARPVIAASAEERSIKISSKHAGAEVNAMTFKGRAERLGWSRGSVCDGGGITCYLKRFPGAGADAIVLLDGMYIGIDMYSSITLGQFMFVKSGSVAIGSYTYDEPANEQDARLIPFAEVPPIVFSESLGDLARISGKAASVDEDAVA